MRLNNLYSCKLKDNSVPETIVIRRLQLQTEASEGNHLHICTSAHLHIFTFAHPHNVQQPEMGHKNDVTFFSIPGIRLIP